MATVKLQVAGIGYDGGPAGSGGNQFDADENGTDKDRVFYKASSGGLGGALKEAVFGEKIYTAYLDAQGRSALDSAGVSYKTDPEVRSAGMSNYILWRLQADGKFG